MAGAPATAATVTSAREFAGRFCGCSVRGAVPGAENRKLDRVTLARTLRTGGLLPFVQHDLLEVRLAIFTNVFVDGHS